MEEFTRQLAAEVGKVVARRGDFFEGLSLLCYDEHGQAHWSCSMNRNDGGDPHILTFQASQQDGKTVDEIATRMLDRIY